MLLITELSACILNSDYNYRVQAPTARELLHRLDLLQDNLEQEIIHSKSLPMIILINEDHPQENRLSSATVHLLPSTNDLYKNVLGAHLILEKYLINCEEENRDLIIQMHNAKQIFRRMGEVKSRFSFVKGTGISDDEVNTFAKRFFLTHRQYGLEFTDNKDSFEVIIRLNKIKPWASNSQQYLNYKSSTPKTISYDFHSTDFNGNAYHEYRTFQVFSKILYMELPLRFKKGASFGIGKYLFQYFDPYSEYDISLFIRILTLGSFLIYVTIYRKEIKNAWTKRVASSSPPGNDR